MHAGEPQPMAVPPTAAPAAKTAPAPAVPNAAVGGPGLTTASTRPGLRIESIDLVRGLVMLLMALDHTRGFFYSGQHSPTDLQQASAALFFTRLITHLCAPAFVFLAGASAFLSGAARNDPRASRSRHLLARGIWLIVLELTLVKFGWSLGLNYEFVGLQVIWALGWCFVALAGLIWLPPWGIAAVGGGMVLLHNLTDLWGPDGSPFPRWLWTLLHVRGDFSVGPITVYVLYPLVPWIGVMALGYLFGASLVRERRSPFALLGLGALALFVALRGANLYGDPSPWGAPEGRPAWFAALAFVNTTKYPPSLLFLLMTLGTMFLLLAAAESWTRGSVGIPGRARQALLVFGRVPLFFYLIHLPLIHGLAVLNRLIREGPPRPGMQPWEWGQEAAYDLPGVYLVWILVILILYPLCARYDAYRRARRSRWTRYL